jgi:uncharacterized protein
MIKPLNSILIKPAGPDCNMHCTYCFYRKKADLFPDKPMHRMTDEILQETVIQAMEQGGGSISFGWQGGEPTLMGLDFFRNAVSYQQRYGCGQTVGNGLQTNGILIDRKWAEFLREYNFLVGLSLDGPEHIHDRYRFDCGGKGTWAQVADRAGLLLDAGVAVNALVVVNDHAVHFPDEIYNYHKKIGITHLQFIPCLEPDPRLVDAQASFSTPVEEYGRFLARVFDLWLADFRGGKPTTSIRFFDSVFYAYVGLTPPDCTLLFECGVYVVVEHNGDVYSCDFFVEPRWRLGNVLEGSLAGMLNSEQQALFGRLKSSLAADCLQCRWLPYCRGGCPKDRRFNTSDRKLDHFCASYKIFFAHAHERLQSLAEEWKKAQARTVGRPRPFTADSAPKPGRNDSCPCGSGLKYKKCCG